MHCDAALVQPVQIPPQIPAGTIELATQFAVYFSFTSAISFRARAKSKPQRMWSRQLYS